MSPRTILPILAALLICATGASADTIIVKPDGTGDYATIQEAIDAASAGDEIVLTDGTFFGSGNRGIEFRGKALTLRSQSGNPGLCVLDAGFLSRVFHIHEGEGDHTVIDGITIRHGDAGSDDGGGMRCGGTSPTIRDCVFEGCTAGNEGGGLYAANSDMTVEDCEFVQNTAQHGGGMYCISSDHLAVTGSRFYQNHADEIGGGLMIKTSDSPTFTDCEFEDNVADAGGGAAVWEGNSVPIFLRAVIFDNEADQGGGFYCKDSTPILQACTISDNASPVGGGVYAWSDGHPQLENTIVAFSADGAGVECSSSSSAYLSCCDVYGNAGGDYTGCISSQDAERDNFSANPLFCNRPTGNYYLDINSPCADATDCGQVGAFAIGCNQGDVAIDDTEPDCPLPSAIQGHAYPAGTIFSAFGGNPPYIWSQAGLPAGLDIDDESGEIEGFPTEAGFFTFTVTVTDQLAGTAERACSLSVIPALYIDPVLPACPLPDAVVGEPYPSGMTFTADGGTPPYTWSQTGLPAGIDIDPVTGSIGGVAAETGDFDFTVMVTDDEARTADRDCSIRAREPLWDLTIRDGITVRGSDIDIPVECIIDGPIKAYSLGVLFDQDVFEVRPGIVDTSGTSTVGAEIVAVNSSDSTISMAVVHSYSCPPQIEAGSRLLAKLLLHVKDDAPGGPTVLTFVDVPPIYNRMTLCDGSTIHPRLNPKEKGEFDIQLSLFVRGDVNGDGDLTIEDPMLNIAYQIGSGGIDCLDAADTDGDGEVNISDPVWSLDFQFGSGPEPGDPYPECGLDSLRDSLDCVCSAFCSPCAVPAAEPSEVGATVAILVGEGTPAGSDQVIYPVYVNTDAALAAWEYVADFARANVAFDHLEASGCDYASGRLDSATGTVRFGQVASFGMSSPLSSGVHEVGAMVCNGASGGGGPVELSGGLYVAADGESGPAEVGVATGIERPDEELPAPRRFHSYATPNPFNPAVTIHFEIPAQTRTTIGIYDPSGRLVRELLDKAVPAGRHEVVWNGTNGSGAPVGSGAYFYKIRSGPDQQTRKLILLR